MIHNNISIAWSLVFIPMVPHPPAAPSSFSKAGTKTLLALPFPQVLPSYLQVTINCPLHKHARRRLQTKHPLLFPSLSLTAADIAERTGVSPAPALHGCQERRKHSNCSTSVCFSAAVLSPLYGGITSAARLC